MIASDNILPGILKRIGLLGLSALLKFIIQVAVVIFFSHGLSLEQYGDYQFIWMFVNFFSILSLFGLSNFILSTRIEIVFAIIAKYKKLVIRLLILVNIGAILFLSFSKNGLDNVERILLILLLILQNISSLIDAIAVKNEQEKKLAKATFLYLILFSLAHIWFYFHQENFLLLLILLLTATLLKIFLLYNPTLPSWKSVSATSSQSSQWLFLGLNEVLAITVKWIDKWVLIFFLSSTQFAIYFNGSYEIPIFILAVSAIGNVALVEFSNKEKDTVVNAKLFYGKIALFMAIWVFPSFWFFQQFGSEFIEAMFGEKYLPSIPIFLVSIWVLPVRIIHSTAVLQSLGKSQIILKGSLLDLAVAIVLMIAFYQFWELKGVALAFVIATYLQVAYYLHHSSKLLGIKIIELLPTKKLLILFAVSALCIYGLSFLSVTHPALERLFVGILGTATLVLVFFLVLRFGKKKLSR